MDERARLRRRRVNGCRRASDVARSLPATYVSVAILHEVQSMIDPALSGLPVSI